MLASIVVSVTGMVGAAFLVAIGRAVVRVVAELARGVRASTTAVTSLVGSVAELQRDNAENRERIASLIADRWPHDTYPGFTPHHRWTGRT